MLLLIKRKIVSIRSYVNVCVCISNFYEEETLMWWKAQCVCLCHHQKHQQPYENSTDKHDVCMREKKEDETNDGRRAGERVIKEEEEKKSVSVEYARPIEIARCCIVIRRLNRNNTHEGRERERERGKNRKKKCRACLYVCDCHIGSSHAHIERMKVVVIKKA